VTFGKLIHLSELSLPGSSIQIITVPWSYFFLFCFLSFPRHGLGQNLSIEITGLVVIIIMVIPKQCPVLWNLRLMAGITFVSLEDKCSCL
jgi:hypothetical protein